MPKYVKTDKYFTLKTKHGQTVIELFARKAPNHVKRIQELIEAGYYNDLKFHRVIDGFMAQTSDVEFKRPEKRRSLKLTFIVEHQTGENMCT